jgi:hypothetical protein
MAENGKRRFDLVTWGALAVLTELYFAFTLTLSVMALLRILLVSIAAIFAVAGFYRTTAIKTFGSRSMQNHKVKDFRFIICVLLICTAGLITADFAPHRAVFIPCLFMALFAPIVLIPIHNKRTVVFPSNAKPTAP